MSRQSTLNSSVALVVASAALAVLAVACRAADSDPTAFKSGKSGQGGTGGNEIIPGSGGGTDDGGLVGVGVDLSGRVMAPSGAFPVSGALIYLTQGQVEPIPAGVYHYECDDMTGTPYTFSNPDGTWALDNAPTGTWNLVTRKGNFRRVREIQITEDMNTAVHEEMTTLPGRNSSDGLDAVPSYAVVKTSPDLTYNLLAKFGMAQADASGDLVLGTESFDIYQDSGSGSYPHTRALFENQNLFNYHMIFLPCSASSVGVAYVNDHAQALRDYVAAGGRVYNSCTVSLWSEAPFPDYIDFYSDDDPTRFDIGRRTSSAYETSGTVLDQGLAAWMNVVTAGDPNQVPFQKGYVTIDATQEVDDGHGLEKDGFVVKPYTWVRDNDRYAGSPLMVTYNYDFGKVFYSVYETSSNSAAITPQEYVLLYVILEVGVCSNLPPDIK